MKTIIRKWLGLLGNKTGGSPANGPASRGDRQAQVDALEPRVLFSGAPVESSDEEEDQAADTQTSESAAASVNPMEQGVIGDQTGSDQIAVPAAAPVTLFSADAATAELNEETLRAIADAAKQRWIEAGLTAEQVAALDGVSYQIADLSGHALGVASGSAITIDLDAAGNGWFVDATPDIDEEYALSEGRWLAIEGNGAEATDLLTLVLHEQGHILGLSDLVSGTGDVMSAVLNSGERRLPAAGQAFGAVPGTLDGEHFLLTTETASGGAVSLIGDTANDVLDIRIQSNKYDYRLNSGSWDTIGSPPHPNVDTITTFSIEMGGGNDTINLPALYSVAPALTIDGGTGTDIINFTGNNTLGSGRSISATAETINTNAGVNLVTSGGGGITFTANAIAIGSSSALNAGAGTVTLKTQTAATAINLGTETGGSLSLTDTELDGVTAGTLVVGDSASGAITVSAGITRSSATSITLNSGSSISFAAGSLNSGGGNVTLNAATSIGVGKAGADVTATGATLSFGSGTDLAIAINGTTADSQYDQLNADANIVLTGLDLVLSGNHTPIAGQTFTIVNNTGAGTTTGTFTGLAQGANITNFLGSGLNAAISYTGGDGNDVILVVGVLNTAPELGAIGNQSINELNNLSFTATATDANIPAQALTFTVDAASVSKGISINASTGVFSWTPGESQDGSHSVTVTVTDNGTGNLSDSEAITITVNEVNVAPELGAIGNQSVDELANLAFTATATDADITANVLTFSLDAASLSKGMAINGSTGVFSWTPSESQDGSHSVTVTVTDNGTGNLSDSEAITITVNEVNVAPELGAIGNQSVDELVNLAFTTTATDADIAANVLTFSLDAASVSKGMAINASTGAFSWTPTESQDGAYTVTVTVTDNGTGNLSDSEVITITVNEVNVAPELGAIGNQSVDELVNLAFTATATDADIAANVLTFSLDAASVSKGMSINVSTGVFSWTPTESQDGSHSVTVTVTDNGTGNLSDSEAITIAVNEVNVAPELGAIGNQSVDELVNLAFSATATDADVTANVLTFSLDAVSMSKGMAINASTGAFSWTPDESQDGSHSVTVTVTDNGTGNLSDSEAITITVNEVNVAPELGAIGNQSVNELVNLAFTATATDADITANVLTFSLDAASVSKGMAINASTGVFSWTPTGAQDGNHTVTVTVTDNGTGNLSDSEAITITVNDFVTTEVTVDGNGTLNITDVLGGNTSDNLTIKVSGTDFRITDPGNDIDETVSIASVTGDIVIEGLDGDDTLTLDLSGGPLGRNIVFNGGAGGNDTLRIIGNGTEAVIYRPDAATFGNGIVNIGGQIITFTGLEPVEYENLASVTITFANGNDIIDLAQGVNGNGAQAVVVSGTSGGVGFETAVLRNVGTLTIDTATSGTDGSDTVTISSAANAHGVGNLSIATGDAGTDTVTLNGNATFSGNVTIQTESIALNGGGGARVLTAANAVFQQQLADTVGISHTLGTFSLTAAELTTNLAVSGGVTIGRADGTGQVNVVNSALNTTGEGYDLTIIGGNAVSLGAFALTVDGDVSILTNQDGAGTDAFAMVAATSIVSNSGSIAITTNTLGGGTGTAAVGNLSVSSGQAITVNHLSGGAMTHLLGTTWSAPGAGNVTVSGAGAVTLQGTINAGSGLITVNANNDNSGSDGLTTSASANLTTTNTTSDAIRLRVNAAGGSGSVIGVAGNFTTGNGGGITVSSRSVSGGNSSSVTVNTATFNAGVNGTVLIDSEDMVSMSGTHVLTIAGGSALTINANQDLTGAQSVQLGITSSIVSDSTLANAVQVNTKGGSATMLVANISVGNGGGITIDNDSTGSLNHHAGTISAAGAGNITLNSIAAIGLNGTIDGGSGLIDIFGNSDASGSESLSMAATANITTTNSTADAIRIRVNNAAAGSGSGDVNAIGGLITAGNGGTITVSSRSLAGGNTADLLINNVTFNAGATGAVVIDAEDGVQLNASQTLTVSGGSTLTLNVNQDLAGSQGITMSAGSAIVSDSASANAVRLNNKGGTGTSLIQSITVSNGGGILIDHDSTGSLTHNGGTISAAGSGNVTLDSISDVTLAGTIDAGSGRISIHANSDGAGSDNVIFGVGGAYLTTTNSTASAMVIRVNDPGSGTGTGDISNLRGNFTVGNGGTITVTSATASGGNASSISIGNANISAGANGSIVFDSEDAVTISAGAAVSIIDSTLTILANQDGAGNSDFVFGAGASLATTNAGANAVSVTVNTSGGGTGAAIFGNTTIASGGTLTVAANQGRVETLTSATVSVANGTVNLRANDAVISGNLSAVGGTVTFDRSTSGTIGLGAGFGDMNLAQAELNRISAATLNFGSTNAADNNATVVRSNAVSTTAGITGLTRLNALDIANADVQFMGASSFNAIEANANDAVDVLSTGSVTTAVGNLTFNADADGSGAGSMLMNTGSSLNTATPGGHISITAADMNVANAISINAGNGSILLRPSTDGVSIGLGGGAGAFGLSDGELALFASNSTLTVGRAGTGTGTVDLNAVDLGNGSYDFAAHGGSIVVVGLDLDEKNVSLTANTGNITDGGAGTDITGANVTLSALNGTIGTTLAALDLQAVNLSATTATGGGNQSFNDLDSVTLISATAGSGTITINGGEFDLTSNSVSDASAVVVQGTGTLDINGVTETVASVTVKSGGTLKGTGTLNAPVTVEAGGNFAPGQSPGILATGNLSVSGNYTVEVDGGLGAGVVNGHDRTDVTGTVTLANATSNLVVDITDITGGELTAGDELVIISNDGNESVSGVFSNFGEGTIVHSNVDGVLDMVLTYHGGDGNDVALRIGNLTTRIYIDGSDNLIIEDINDDTDDNLTVSVSGGNLTVTEANGAILIDAQGILDGTTGDLTDSVTVALSSFTGNVILRAGNGTDAILLENVDLIGTQGLTVEDGNGTDSVTFQTSASDLANGTVTVEAETVTVNAAIATGGAGNVTLEANANNLVINANVTTGGAGIIDLDAGGAIAQADGSVISTGSGAITLDAVGNITLAALSTTGNVTATSTAGGILDGGDTHTDVVAASFAATGSLGVGSGANAIETQVSNFEANGGTGGIFVSNTGNLSIGGVNGTLSGLDTSNADIEVAGTGSVSLGEEVSSTGGDISLTADSDGNNNGTLSVVTSGISADGGSIILQGRHATESGVVISNDVSTSGNGSITITGYGGNGVGDRGVAITGGANAVSLAGGDIQINGNSSGDYGTLISNADLVSTTGNIDINGVSTGGDGSHGVFVWGTLASVGSSGGQITIDGTSANGAGVAAQGSSITNTGVGTITITGTGGTGANDDGVFLNNSTTLVQTVNGAITITGTSSGGGGVVALDADIVSALGNIDINGTATGGDDDRGVFILGSSASVSSSGGQITIDGTSAGDTGVQVQEASVTNSGLGTLAITGTGGSGATDNGVLLNGAAVQISTANGDLSITGNTSGNGGVVILGADVATTGGGLTINGTATGGSVGSGVFLLDSSGSISTADGAVSIQGTSANEIGVQIRDGGVSASGTGTLEISGTGGGGANDHGVYIHGVGVAVTSNSGDISISGESAGDADIHLTADGEITSTSGDITLVADDITIDGDISSGGNLTIAPRTASTTIGVGGGAGTLNLSDAELANLLDGFASITIGDLAAGTGDVDIDSAVFTDDLTVVGGSIAVEGLASAGNDLTLTARTGNITDGGGTTDVTATNATLNAFNGAIGSVGEGAIDLDVSSIATNTSTGNGSQFLNETDTVTVAGFNAGTGTVNLVGGEFDISSSEVVNNATSIAIGANATLDADATETLAAVTVEGNATLKGNGAVLGAITVLANGTITPGEGNGTADLGTGSLSMNQYGVYSVNLNGTTADTQYDQLDVTGTVSLGNATLSLGVLGFTPTAGQTFTLIDNDGVDAVTGIFSGLANGTYISVPTGGGLPDELFQISYTGGTGNDVVLTATALPVTSNVYLDGAGNLVVEDILGGNTTDTLSISVSGGNLIIEDTAGNVLGTLIVGATQTHTNRIVIPVGLITGGDITINTLGGNDTITIGDLGTLGGNLTVDGGTGQDSIIHTGNATLTGAHELGYVAEVIQLNGNSSITTDSGNISLQGNTGGTGTGRTWGVTLTDANLTSTTGNIDIDGRGGSTLDRNFGVYLTSGSAITTGGDITIDGTGGGNGSSSVQTGVFISATTISATGTGDLSIGGQGGNGSQSGDGVVIEKTSTLQVASGNLSLVGTGANTGSINRGIVLISSTVAATAGGNVLIEGTGNAGSSSEGVETVSATVSTNGAGTLTIRGTGGTGADNNVGVNLSTNTQVTAVNGAILIEGTSRGTNSNNHGVGIYANSKVNTATGSGNVTVLGTGGVATLSGSGVLISSGNLTVSAGDLSIQGTGRALTAGRGIDLTKAILLSTGAGDIDIDGTGSTTGNGTNNKGVAATTANITLTGAGSLSIDGTGGNGTTGGSGVSLATTTSVSTASGHIDIRGTAGGTRGTAAGVEFLTTTTVTAGTTGNLTILGTGSALGISTTSANRGVTVGGASTLNVNNGELTLTGTAGGAGLGTANHGIDLSGGKVKALGSGNLVITGTGAKGGTGINGATATITTVGGNITMTGHGGVNTSNNRGIYLTTSTVQSSSGGTILLTGVANALTTGTGNTGVYILNSTMGTSGSFTIIGTGGGGTGSNHGIHLQGITGTTSASVTTSGTVTDGKPSSKQTIGNFFP